MAGKAGRAAERRRVQGRGRLFFPAGRGRGRPEGLTPRVTPGPASARRQTGPMPGPAAGQNLGGRASQLAREEDLPGAAEEVVLVEEAGSPARSTLPPSPPVSVGDGSPRVASEEAQEEGSPPVPGPSQASSEGSGGGGMPEKEPAKLPPAKRPRVAGESSSVVWDHFELRPGDPTHAECTHCKALVSRGKDPKHFTTSGLSSHLLWRHPGVETSAGTGSRPSASTSSSSDSSSKRPVAPAPRQEKLTYCHQWVQSLGKWSDRPKPHLVTRAIAEMIALDDQPLSIVENVGFRRLLQLLSPDYKIPSRTTFSRRVVPSLYRACREAVLARLRAAGPSTSVHFTADIWTSRSGLHTAFMSLTAHWWGHGGEGTSGSAGAASSSSHACTPSWAVLHVEAMDTDHRSDELAAIMDRQVWAWLAGEPSLRRGFMVTDNAANISKAARQVCGVSIACVAHTLNLVVQDALGLKEASKSRLRAQGVSSAQDPAAPVAALVERCRKIAGHFHRREKARRRRLLKARQIELGLPEHLLPQDVPTRWNSTFLLLRRMHEQKGALHSLARHGSLEVCKLVHGDWQLISELVSVLEPFYSATSDLCTQTATLSQALPAALLLEKAMSDLQTTLTTGVAIALAGRLRTGVVERLKRPLGASAWHVLACICDPRMKGSAVPPGELPKWRGLLVEHVKREEERRLGIGDAAGGQEEGSWSQPGTAHPTPSSSSSTATTPTSSQSSGVVSPAVAPAEQPVRPRTATRWLRGYASLMPGRREEPAPRSSRAEQSVLQYLEEEAEDEESEPFLFWATRRKAWPDLATVAVRCLSCPPTSVSSERLFSMAGDVVTPLRSRLDAELAEQLVFLKLNLPLLGYPELAVEGE
ncbi:zinc finger BED domain-containing protein 4-like [Hemicordylus capensis]|uniref:zinc finger BED domain-containing protein 4-like n=1 Tax=Hemicordylus capensis TaxID=884348 RepID=UPI0023033F48|nr:zinc finger BED domain-containing protein 4-like [Hemicordylus capensis]XP_053158127.1 zinc finger BED domain-containing protein 4-like [Hemicordylus capensis]XP_053158128.1 zinc finger BED domain-containing protein 4-like [Hemicordylus capensis]XP_053158129.1 zinc finger BED domain-containing protein 4-like [Hemicordylus capensis]